MQTVQWFRRSS